MGKKKINLEIERFMVSYPSYTLTIADGVSPVAIGRPKRFHLCLHCVILFSCTRPASHHSRSLFPSISVSPAESLCNAAALRALNSQPPASPAAEDDP